MDTLILPPEFPKLLREIPDPPQKLHVKGRLPSESEYKFLCIVGSRKFTSYGKETTEKLIEGLSGYPIVIVSGLALGIDSIAHETALRNNLLTIAFPGSGLHESVIYPKSNLSLARRILEKGGALVSEFDAKFAATPYSFPQRNRLMAGISHATLVIEAEAKSGTLITSKFATEYNRDVFTVPGSIFSKTSEGPFMLLRLGATPVSKSEDILEALHIPLKDSEEKQKALFNEASANEKKVLELLKTPVPKDELLEKLNLPIGEANSLLSIMEIKGMIKETLGEMRQCD